MTSRRQREWGITIIEVLIAVAVASLLLGALVLFARRGFDISREHTEQSRITEEARIHMERMSDNIRNARSIDVNGDGLMTLPSELWVQEASPNQLIIYTNIDTDDEVEKVRYYLAGTELTWGVFDPYDAADERINILSRWVRNLEAGQALFTYQTGEGVTTSAPPSLASVAVVGIHLVVDVNEQQYPTAATIETLVVPRGTATLTGTAGSGGGNGGGPLPVVDLKINGSDGPLTYSFFTAPDLIMSWVSTNATSCQASGGWSGSKPLASLGENIGRATSSQTYALTCSNPSGSGSDSAQVFVTF